MCQKQVSEDYEVTLKPSKSFAQPILIYTCVLVTLVSHYPVRTRGSCVTGSSLPASTSLKLGQYLGTVMAPAPLACPEGPEKRSEHFYE